MLATAASGQAKHHPVYPGTRTVRGAIWDRLGEVWRLTEDALLKSERLRLLFYSRHEPCPLLRPTPARSTHYFLVSQLLTLKCDSVHTLGLALTVTF